MTLYLPTVNIFQPFFQHFLQISHQIAFLTVANAQIRIFSVTLLKRTTPPLDFGQLMILGHPLSACVPHNGQSSQSQD